MLFNVLGNSNFSLYDAIVYILSALAVIFLTMPVHEFAHAYAAYKLGDSSQRYAGRLTLNPFAHIDWFGALSILLVGVGWAKPVQVNPFYFKNRKRGMAITAFAGPFANLLVAFGAVLLQNVAYFVFLKTNFLFVLYVVLFFYYIALINISLAVFNLIPVPPLDGSKILAIVLPDRLYYKLMQYERYLYLALLILIFTGVLRDPINSATSYIYGAFDNLTWLPFNLLI